MSMAIGPSAPCVRIAEIEVDPARLQAYQAALREEIDAAVRLEPGVLALHAVCDKDDSSRVIVFEIYAHEAAYQAHLATAHFVKYKSATQDMVVSLRLREAVPIALGAKAK
jgi:quinol monooxygenase YgiN